MLHRRRRQYLYLVHMLNLSSSAFGTPSGGAGAMRVAREGTILCVIILESVQLDANARKAKSTTVI